MLWFGPAGSEFGVRADSTGYEAVDVDLVSFPSDICRGLQSCGGCTTTMMAATTLNSP